jgi:hypothetical protein
MSNKFSDIRQNVKRVNSNIYLKFEHFIDDVHQFGLKNYAQYLDRHNIGNFLMEDQVGFRFSQVVDVMIYYYETHQKDPTITESLIFQSISNKNTTPYIIPVAVQYNPADWTDVNHIGMNVEGKKSIFERINPLFLSDLQNGKALLLIDQSVEGYSARWLWDWFHAKCRKYKISPSAIVYMTGDQSCADTYEKWCTLHRPAKKLKVIPSISLSTFVHKHYMRHNLQIDFDDILKHKTENKDKIYLYDCTNKRPRNQRVFNFLHLLHNDLLDEGNISMPAQDTWNEWIVLDENNLKENGLDISVVEKLNQPNILPREAKYNYTPEITHYFSYVERILDDMYRNSWVSLVVESSYYQREYSVFISEKSFKPIAAMQPFITVGSKGTLAYLRKLGFKTFHPFIDESYDEMNDTERFQGIMNALKKIKAIEDKSAWLESMRDILVHNHKLFVEIGTSKSIEHTELVNYYFNYFGDKNV